ncbi:MAG: fumarylacetoacetate hydrolase family protein [Planctomycetales bacterium]
MKLVKYRHRSADALVGVLDGEQVFPMDLEGRQYRTLADVLEEDVLSTAQFLVNRDEAVPLSEVTLLPPIDQQEVWAAGVTYKRSQQARMEESDAAASCYDRVYQADRPELFFKATPHRVVGHNDPIRIRSDSKWNVPEPELALVLSSALEIVGFTIGNDMSSRDIEGENPLYLPQAKVYDHCCGLGPCITLKDSMPPLEEIEIRLRIRRGNFPAFDGAIKLSSMARKFEDLIEYLARDNTFPDGVFLLTGTGIVPTNDFTLEQGDSIEIDIDGIGTLANTVVQG